MSCECERIRLVDNKRRREFLLPHVVQAFLVLVLGDLEMNSFLFILYSSLSSYGAGSCLETNLMEGLGKREMTDETYTAHR